jgi:hypothetical protein
MGRITRGPPFWTRSQDETTSSQVFVRRHMRRRVSLPVVLSPLVQRVRRSPRAKGGVFAFAPTPAILQAACLSIPLAGSMPVLRHTLCSSSLACHQGSSAGYQYYVLYGHYGARRSSRRHWYWLLLYVFPPFCPWAHMSGPTPLYVPSLSYKREGTRCYKASSLSLNLGSHTHSNSQVHTSSQAQYITQWSRVLRSGGSNHSKSLCVLVFFSFPPNRQNA